MQQAFVTVASVGAAFITAAALTLPPPCSAAGSDQAGKCINDWALLGVPAAATILLAILAGLAQSMGFTGVYAGQLEKKLSQLTGDQLSVNAPLGQRVRGPHPRFFSLHAQIFVGRGRMARNKFWWDTIIVLIVGLIISTAVYPLIQARWESQVVALVTFVPVNLLTLSVHNRFGSGRRTLAEHMVANQEAEALIDQHVSLSDFRRRTATRFMIYLVFPRPLDHLPKLIYVPIGFILAWASMPSVGWAGLSSLIFVVVVFEFLLYQARYMFNDLHGLSEDAEHEARRSRSRIPEPHTRTRLTVVSITALGRIALYVALVVTLSPSPEARAALVAGGVLVFALGLVYDSLRARLRELPKASSDGLVSEMSMTEILVSRRVKLLVAAIVGLVGCGYAIRVSVGAWASSGGQVGFLPLVLLGCAAYGSQVAGVSMCWVLEGSAYLPRLLPARRCARFLRRKLHILWLAHHAGLLTAPTLVEDQITRSAKAGKVLRMETICKEALWQYAFAGGLCAGYMFGYVAAANPAPPRLELLLLIGALGAFTGIGAAVRCPWRWPSIHCVGALAAAAISFAAGDRRWWLLSIPPLLLVTSYEMTRNLSYYQITDGVLDGFKQLRARALSAAWRATVALIGEQASRTIWFDHLPNAGSTPQDERSREV